MGGAMSVVLIGSTSGSVTLQEPAVAGTTVLTLPTTSGTVLTSASTGISASNITTGTLPYAQLPVGSVLQVVSTTLTSSFTSTSSSYTDWTGLSATITPKFTTSKILVQFTSATSGSQANMWNFVKIQRNGTDMVLGDVAGDATRCFSIGAFGNNSLIANIVIPLLGIYLDSPSTTSAVTYQAQVITTNGGTAYFGRTANVADANRGSCPSTITVMEIAG